MLHGFAFDATNITVLSQYGDQYRTETELAMRDPSHGLHAPLLTPTCVDPVKTWRNPDDQSLSPGRRTVARSPSGHGIAISPNATLLLHFIGLPPACSGFRFAAQNMILDVDTLLVGFWGS